MPPTTPKEQTKKSKKKMSSDEDLLEISDEVEEFCDQQIKQKVRNSQPG